jgi:hypothetical protein
MRLLYAKAISAGRDRGYTPKGVWRLIDERPSDQLSVLLARTRTIRRRGALIARVVGPANPCRAPAAVRDRHTEVLVMTDGVVLQQPSCATDEGL